MKMLVCFYQHKDPNDPNKRFLRNGEYIFTHGSGGQNILLLIK
jgi:hypothetical protein